MNVTPLTAVATIEAETAGHGSDRDPRKYS
jgi:hypothetical protein